MLIPDFVAPLIDKIKQDFMWTCDEGALTGLYLGVHAGLVDKTVRAKYFHPQVACMCRAVPWLARPSARTHACSPHARTHSCADVPNGPAGPDQGCRG